MKKVLRKRPPISGLQRKMFSTAFITAACTEFAQIIALTIDSVIICIFLGEDEIAAVGLACPFFFLVGIPTSCLASGLQTVCSRNMGRGKIEEANRAFNQCVLFILLSMTLLTLAVFLTVPLMAYCFGARGETADLKPLTEAYLYGLAFEVVPFVMMSSVTTAVVLDNDGRTAMLASVIGGVANISFDFCAIRFQWGLFGIGLGSSMSAVVSLLVLLTHFLRKNRVYRFKFTRVRFREIREIIRMGLPASIHALASMIRAMAMNVLAIYTGGSAAVAVLSIHGTVMDFVDIPVAGIQGAVGILTGIGYGENNGEDIEGTGRLAHHYVFVISWIILAGLLYYIRPVAEVFLDVNSDGYTLLIFSLICIAIGGVFNGLIHSRVSYLQAIGSEKNARHMEELSNLVLLITLAVALSVPFHAYGIFAAFPLSKLVTLGLVYLKYVRKSKKKIPGARDYMELESHFYQQPENMIVQPIDSLEKCIQVSNQIVELCEAHGFGGRTAYFAGLCAEEIATNILKHGFKYKRADVNAEIRATISGDTLIMRVRDNGIAFNMNSLAKILSEDQTPYKNLGIKIICAAATEISYYNLYGMNTTIIRIQQKAPAQPVH